MFAGTSKTQCARPRLHHPTVYIFNGKSPTLKLCGSNSIFASSAQQILHLRNDLLSSLSPPLTSQVSTSSYHHFPLSSNHANHLSRSTVRLGVQISIVILGIIQRKILPSYSDILHASLLTRHHQETLSVSTKHWSKQRLTPPLLHSCTMSPPKLSLYIL